MESRPCTRRTSGPANLIPLARSQLQELKNIESEEFRSDSQPVELKPSKVQLSTFCVRLKPASAGHRSNTTDRFNAESAFRFIPSIPSPTAEPLKPTPAHAACKRLRGAADSVADDFCRP